MSDTPYGPTDYSGPWPPIEDMLREVYEQGYPIEIAYSFHGGFREARNFMAKVDAALAAKPDTKKALVLSYALKDVEGDHVWLSSRTFTGDVGDVRRQVDAVHDDAKEDGCDVLGMVLTVVTEEMMEAADGNG